MHAWFLKRACLVLKRACFVFKRACFVLKHACFVFTLTCLVLKHASFVLEHACPFGIVPGYVSSSPQAAGELEPGGVRSPSMAAIRQSSTTGRTCQEKSIFSTSRRHLCRSAKRSVLLFETTPHLGAGSALRKTCGRFVEGLWGSSAQRKTALPSRVPDRVNCLLLDNE